MTAIDPGQYTYGELLQRADVDVTEVAKVDYNARGWDSNRVRVGGLRFDELDDIFHVPQGATEVEVTVDGEPVAKLDVNTQEVPEADANFQALRESGRHTISIEKL